MKKISKKKKDGKSALIRIATMLGLGGTAKDIADRDEENTKAGKKASTTISKS